MYEIFFSGYFEVRGKMGEKIRKQSKGSSELISLREEMRTVADGVEYRRKMYRNRDGNKVVMYAVTVAPDALAYAAVWAAPQGQTKIVPLQVNERDVIN